MIYLYNSTETDFRYNGKPLPSAYDVDVRFTLNGEYYVTGKHPLDNKDTYKEISEDRIVKVHTMDGMQPFRIVNTTKHELYVGFEAWPLFYADMRTKLVKPLALRGVGGQVALDAFVNNLLIDTPFNFYSDITETHDYHTQDEDERERNPKQLYNALDVLKDIVNRWGGELWVRGYDIRVNDRIGTDTEAMLYEKKNISEFVDTTNIEGIVTRLHGISEWTGEREEGQDEAPEHRIETTIESPLINNYSGVIFEKQYRNNDTRTKKELEDWLRLKFTTENIDKPQRTIEVGTHIIDGTSVKAGDTLVLKYIKHDVEARIKVVGYEYDGFADELKRLILGEPKTTSASTIGNSITNLVNNAVSPIDRKTTIAMNSADGKSTVFHGTADPNTLNLKAKENDTYFRTNGNEKEIWRFTGTLWELIMDTSDTTKNAQEIEAAMEEVEEAKRQAKLDTEQALIDAKAHADAEVERMDAELTTEIGGAIEIAEQAKADAVSKANQALIDAKAHAEAEDARIRGELESEVDGAIALAEQAKQDAIDKSNQALVDAKAHADAEILLIETHFDDVIEGVESDVADAKQTADDAMFKINNDIANKFTSLDDELVDIEAISNAAKTNAQTAINHSLDALEDAGTALNNAQTALDQVDGAIVSASDALTKANDAHDAATILSGQVSGFETTVAGFNQTVNNYTGQVSGFRNDILGLESTVANYETEVDQFGNAVSTYATEVSTMRNTVSGFESTVATYGTQVSGLAGEVVGYKNQVSTLNNTVSGFESTVTEVRNEFDNLEIGGRNYFSLKEFQSLSPSSWTVTAYLYRFTLEPNTEYTVSSNVPYVEGNTSTAIYFNGATTSTDGVWLGKSATKTADSKGELFIAIPTSRPHVGSLRSGVYWIQLEKGNKATDWSPAPEDMATSSQVSELSNTVDGFQSKVTKVEQDYAGVSGTVATHTSQISNLNGEIALKANTSTVNTLTGRVTTAETNITANATAIALKASTTSVNTLTGRVSTAETGITANATAIGLKANTTTVNTLTGRVSTAETGITANANAIKLKANTTTVNTLTGRVSTAESNITANAGAISSKVWKTDIQTAVDGIEVGGRNLVLNTGSELRTVTIAQYGLSGMLRVPIDGEKISHGDNVTFSVYIQDIPEGEAVRLRLDWYREDGTYSNVTSSDPWSSEDGRYVFTATIPENTEFTEIRGRIMPRSYAGSYPIQIKEEQLERGNKATDWTPAPEDTTSLIDHVETTLTQKHDAIEATVSSVRTDLTGTTTLLNTTRTTVSGHTSSISTLRTDVNGKATTAQFNTLNSTVNGTIQRVGTAEGKITTIETNVSGLQTTVASKADKTQITQLNNAIVLKADKSDLSDKKDEYTQHITINGNGNTYYPLYFIRGDQSVPRVIRITRPYNAPAPGSVWNPSQPTHPGGINMEWVGNFGGWGGAKYEETITSFGEVYTTLLADLGREHNSQTYAFYLRGGGARYTISSDQPLDLKVGYTTSDTIWGSNKSSAPKTSVNRSRIDGLVTAQNSQISVLSDSINLRVQKNDIINQINVSTEGILIDGKKTHITGTTKIDTGVIKNAHIGDLNASKINAGTINAARLNASAIVTAGLTANVIKSTHIETSTATVDKLFATDAMVNRLTAKSAFITSVKAVDISAARITSGTINAARLNASAIVTAGLTANVIKSTHLETSTATITKLFATDAAVGILTAKTAFINSVKAVDISAARITSGTINAARLNASAIVTAGLTANVVKSTHLETSTATIDKIFATTAVINRLTSKTAFINNIKAIEISADKITAGTIDASKITVLNLDASRLTTGTISGGGSSWNLRTGVFTTTGSNARTTINDGKIEFRNTAGTYYGGMQLETFDDGARGLVIGSGQLRLTQNRLETLRDGNRDLYLVPQGTGAVRVSSITGTMYPVHAQEFSGRVVRFTASGTSRIEGYGSNGLRVVTQDNYQMYQGSSEAFRVQSTIFYMNRDLHMRGNNITNQSDARLKTDIVDNEIDSLEAIKKWRLAGFNWIDNEMNTERQFSVIAQSAPEISNVGENGYLDVNSSKQLSMVTHAVQQLSLREESTNEIAIQALESTESNETKIHKLQQELSKANRRIEELEGIV